MNIRRQISIVKGKGGKKQVRDSEKKLFATGILYLLPAIILLGVFLFYPMLKTFYYSFFKVTGDGETTSFVGWDHYKELFNSSEFKKSIKGTFLFVLYTVPTEIIIGLFIAVLASEKLRGIGFFRTIFASTLGVSVAAGATIFLFLFHPSLGVFNNIDRKSTRLNYSHVAISYAVCCFKRITQHD